MVPGVAPQLGSLELCEPKNLSDLGMAASQRQNQILSFGVCEQEDLSIHCCRQKEKARRRAGRNLEQTV